MSNYLRKIKRNRGNLLNDKLTYNNTDNIEINHQSEVVSDECYEYGHDLMMGMVEEMITSCISVLIEDYSQTNITSLNVDNLFDDIELISNTIKNHLGGNFIPFDYKGVEYGVRLDTLSIQCNTSKLDLRFRCDCSVGVLVDKEEESV